MDIPKMPAKSSKKSDMLTLDRFEEAARLVKEVRLSNTPSSRDSIEFECKFVLKK